MSPREINAAVTRVRAEFIEMPGMRLTIPQASRLWGLDQGACRAVVDTLVHGGFLYRTCAGLVARAEDAR